MTEPDVMREPPQRMPLLADDELRVRPAPRPVIVRFLGGLALMALALAGMFLLYQEPSSVPRSPEDNAYELALSLAPWVITFPVLRRLDLHRVPWFFLCLISPLLGAVLLAFVGYRALSLPYRTWPVAYWQGHRARRIRSTNTWVLLGADEVPEPVLSTWLVRWERIERVAWVFFMVSAVVFKVWHDPLDSVFGGLWFAGLLALAVGPPLIDWLQRMRVRSAEAEPK